MHAWLGCSGRTEEEFADVKNVLYIASATDLVETGDRKASKQKRVNVIKKTTQEKNDGDAEAKATR